MAVPSPQFGRLCRWISIMALAFYLLMSLYSAYVLFFKQSIDEALPTSTLKGDFGSQPLPLRRRQPDDGEFKLQPQSLELSSLRRGPVVEIWGKAAIGLYLWEHILGGFLLDEPGKLVRFGKSTIQGIEFRFRTGPGLVQGLVPTDVEHLVLVLNGRDETKVAFARTWLDYLPLLPSLRAAAVVLLDNEQCHDDWLLPYMEFRGGKVRVAFLTYDSPLVDGIHFYQWPLGVATYRQFPRLDDGRKWAHVPRAHICNFVGTVYQGSSRQTLADLLRAQTSLSTGCLVRKRDRWQPEETRDSLQDYVSALSDSDLTLSPVGANAECYRIYEALSCGSIPVVEDAVPEGGRCGGPNRTVLRLLKDSEAPLIYVTDWKTELPAILERFRSMTLRQKTLGRLRLSHWYRRFKETLRARFVHVVGSKLLAES